MIESHQRVVLALLCGAVFMTVVDLAVVNVALPTIQADLHLSAADLQWVVLSYGLTVGGSMLIGGRAGDLFGHRRMLACGLSLLGAGSLAAGLSGALAPLVAARAGQGLGAALAAPNALALLVGVFNEGPERNRALGIFGAAGGAGAIAGSLIGGALVQGGGWRWVFFLNVPLGGLLALLVRLRVPADVDARAGHTLDLRGALALTLGLVALVLALYESVGSGWGSPSTLVPLAGGVCLLAVFVTLERLASAPLIPLAVFRRAALVRACLAATLLWGSFLALIYEMTLFLQQVLHYTPLGAGSSGLTIAIVSIWVSERFAGRVCTRIGPGRTLGAGLVLIALGQLLLSGASIHAHYVPDILGPYVFVGLGVGFAQVAVQIAGFAGVRDADAGLVGGLLETAGEIGGVLGVALIASLAAARLHAAENAGAAHAVALAQAFHRATLACALLALAGSLVVLLGRPARRRRRTPLREQGQG